MRRDRIGQRPPYTAGMLRAGTVLLMALALPACGMKGDLYLPPETPDERVTAPDPAAAEPADKGERRTIPATPDPALSR